MSVQALLAKIMPFTNRLIERRPQTQACSDFFIFIHTGMFTFMFLFILFLIYVKCFIFFYEMLNNIELFILETQICEMSKMSFSSR